MFKIARISIKSLIPEFRSQVSTRCVWGRIPAFADRRDTSSMFQDRNSCSFFEISIKFSIPKFRSQVSTRCVCGRIPVFADRHGAQSMFQVRDSPAKFLESRSQFLSPNFDRKCRPAAYGAECLFLLTGAVLEILVQNCSNFDQNFDPQSSIACPVVNLFV